jgi:carbonic anhydrase
MILADPQAYLTPQDCWDLLEQGNEGWCKTRHDLLRPNQSPARRRAETEQGSPFAVVLSCSDSRVPPEVVFDCGVGDLFVIRLAGTALDDFAIGSIQFAVQVQKFTKLIVVLGHQNCGAVEAAVAGTQLPDPLASLVKTLRPAVEASRNWPGNHVDNAVDANIHLVAHQLEERFKNDGVLVKRKRYSLDTGRVTDPQPWKP